MHFLIDFERLTATLFRNDEIIGKPYGLNSNFIVDLSTVDKLKWLKMVFSQKHHLKKKGASQQCWGNRCRDVTCKGFHGSQFSKHQVVLGRMVSLAYFLLVLNHRTKNLMLRIRLIESLSSVNFLPNQYKSLCSYLKTEL